jgi:hypothetical protein
MAFISEFFESKTGTPSRPHTTCSCGWKVTEREGARVLQLDTYGSDLRKEQGTVSQSIQLDEGHARRLVAIIREAFPGI